MAQIGLAEAIEQLREELGAAQDAGANKQLRFEVTEVELQLQVELRKEGSAKAAFWVLPVAADGMVSRGSSHGLTLKLKVRDEALGGRNAEIGRAVRRGWEEG